MIENNVLTPEQHRELKRKNITETQWMEDFLYILFQKKPFPVEMCSESLVKAALTRILGVLEGRAEAPTNIRINTEENLGGAESQDSSVKRMQGLDQITKKLDEIQLEQRVQISELRDEVRQSHQHDQELVKHVEQITRETIALKNSISKLENTIKVSKISEEEIENELQIKTVECKRLKKENDHYREQLDMSNAEATSESTDVLKTEMNLKDKQITRLRAEIEQKRKEQNWNESEIKNLNEKLIITEREKRQLKRKCDELSLKIEDNDILIANLEETIKKLKGWKA